MRLLAFSLVAAALLRGGLLLAQTSIPEIPYDSAPNLLKLPGHIYLGEVSGVATNSKGNLFVYTRTGTTASTGTSRMFLSGGSRLFEFGPEGRFIREIGRGVYGFVFGQTVRIDPQDNIWVVDDGSNMVIKFDPQGRVLMTLGRKPEAISEGHDQRPPAADRTGSGIPGDSFNRPNDVALDSAGNIFVADGTGNSRIAKFDKNGGYLRSWGSRGTGPGQFNVPHSIDIDSQGNVYVADQENKRIQVFDNNGTFKSQISGVGQPRAICITPGAHQYLFSSSSSVSGGTDPDTAEIYKTELDGRILGKFGKGGKLLKEFDTVRQLDCRYPNVLFVAETSNWRVQKLTLRSKP